MRKFLLVTTFTLIFPTFAHAFSGYNDPAFTFNAQDSDKQWGLPAAGFVDAMDYGSGNPSVVVAIIDTGLDATHEDLAGSHIVPGYDFIHKKPLTGKEDSDDNGHGTLVAGIIAATAGNGKGVAGAAPGLSIMPLKALGSDASATSDVVAEAISYAVSHRADVINLSLGSVSVSSDPLLSSAIEKAYRAGVIIVAAAGNDYQSTGINLDDHPAYPICDDNGENMVIGVTAVDKAMQKPDFANYGQRCIDVAAPGKRILSTINHDPLTKEYKASTYAYVSGTSIASPFVSALAGLIKSRYSYATNVQIREQILRTVRNIDLENVAGCGSGCRGKLGLGIIDANKALAQPIVKQEISEGELVRNRQTSQVFYVQYGRKRLVGSFVQSQRFSTISPRDVDHSVLQNMLSGISLEPLDGTLLKFQDSPAVYLVQKAALRPISFEIFKIRRYNFSSIKVVSSQEGKDWVRSGFLPPPDGTVLRVRGNRTVFWVLENLVHPVSKRYFYQYGLHELPQTFVTPQTLRSLQFGKVLQ